jgi:glycosyltransferase involved in cell wall biosynthesis
MNKKDNKIKRIGIDARFYGPIGKGLGRYTQEIVDNLIKLDTQNEYVIFLYKDNYDEFECDGEKVRKIKVNIRWYTLAEQLIYPFIIWKEKLDLMFFPHFNMPAFTPGKYIITIHDLILTKFPTVRATTLAPWFYKFKNLAYKIIIKLAVRRARKIITVSNFTKNDLIDYFKINPEKIVVTYEGVANLNKNRDDLFTENQDDKKVLLKYNITKPFLLYVGNAYPHKNLESLIEIFPEINNKYPDLNLVMVSKVDYFYARLKKDTEKIKNIIFTDFVPDKDLEILYRNALAYVFPSKYEGFGLPPLEAMAKGCPVVSSNASCLPEILGESAVYFDPESKGEMTEKIFEIIENKDLREDLIKKGHKQARRYNWWECANETYVVIKEVLG